MPKRTILDVNVADRTVLTRVDFNVPLDGDGAITDDRRIRMALPTLTSVLERGGRLVVMSHLGRPKGIGLEPALSLRPAAVRLQELLDEAGVPAHVRFEEAGCTSAAAQTAAAALGRGEVLVLENLRFEAGEKKGDLDFGRTLAAMGDIYCNDAFGTAHRNHASMVAVPEAMAGKPRVTGLLLERELRYLADTIEHAERPFIAVLGGAKVSDKLGAIRHMLARVDAILVGGAMAYTFLRAQGVGVGASRVEEDRLEDARMILEEASRARATIVLPEDHVAAREFSAASASRHFVGAIEDGWMGLDIGPKTIVRFTDLLLGGRTIVWNGPMGVFEMQPFELGTRSVAAAIVEATSNGATSVIGGGDSAAAIEQFGLSDRVTHVSTGGGDSLSMLEGKAFDSVAVLDDAMEGVGQGKGQAEGGRAAAPA